ncbi:type VI secretion system protein TssA [Shewanella sp. Scap07]|uniref:type VI secretion system protein TssA n=1 Tax=Shewanella sp. Scap07 TaxID=2589987 RepID=UPI0015B99620|nr:type VI secretion system protein TssA [Shewanella sp. Scap07]
MGVDEFNIEDYILPISDTNVVGIDPRENVSPTSTYYHLKDVRNSARAKERKALIDEDNVLSVATDWRPIVEQVPEALRNDCKDLEYVAWLIEANCRLSGFRGLANGFELAAKLINDFWQQLYPTPEPDDLSERLSPLIGLNGIDSEGSLIQPIKSILISQGVTYGAFSTWQYDQAQEVARLDKDKQQKRIDAGAVSLEEVEQSIKETAASFYLQLHQDLQDAISAFERLSRAMDDAMDGVPQPTSYISKALSHCLQQVTTIAQPILVKHNAPQETTELDDTDDIGCSDISAAEQGVIKQLQSRDEAINNLSTVAEFFRKTEPHSPMSYAIEQVIRWSDLTLPELLNELIQDGDARSGYFKLSGIKVDE